MSQLPPNWVITGINDVLLPFENGQTLRQGWSPQCEKFQAQTDADWGVLKTTAIQDGEFQPEHNKQLPPSLEPDPLLEVQAGDLLLTCAGPRVRCGVVCLVRKTRKRLMISGKMYRFRAEPRLVLPEYLEAFLRAHDTKKRIDELKTGISDSGLNLTLARFKTIQVPLPPLPEQHRIVAKIEELFSELDKGIENLNQAKAQLIVYRQALLKHAFEGKLTTDWRAAHADEIESGDELIVRIRKESEASNRGVKDKKAASPPRNRFAWISLNNTETSALGQLPHGWAWITLGNLCSSVRNGISVKPADTTGEKILRISAVRPMRIDLNDCRFIEDPNKEFTDYVLETGDLLFTRYNGSRKFVGVCGLFRGSERRVFPDKLIRAKISADSILPEFVEAAVACGPSRAFIESRIRTTAGQAGISGADIKAIPLPICSKAEQQEIISILEKALPHVDSLESEIDINLAKAEALRQSILKKAFAGELVPQDPNDEPALILIARTRVHSEQCSKKGPKASGRKASEKNRNTADQEPEYGSKPYRLP